MDWLDAFLKSEDDDGKKPKPNTHERVTKDEAVCRLRAAGYADEANELDVWRDVNGNNWGWDGWIRGAYPGVVATIWP